MPTGRESGLSTVYDFEKERREVSREKVQAMRLALELDYSEKRPMRMRTIVKQTFGVPSLEVARRIDAQDSALAVQAAVYRAETKLAELRGLYETECSRVRTAMLTEIAQLQIDGGGDE